VLVHSILLNMPINCHPMNLLPVLAAAASHFHIANLFTMPSSSQRFASVVGDICHALLSASAHTTAAVVAAVNTLAAVVATASASDSVPVLHPNLALAPALPIVSDAGASFSLVPFALDFLTLAPCGLILVASNPKVASIAALISKPPHAAVNPHALITGEDVSGDPVDLSSADSNSVVEFASTFATQFRKFDSAALVFHCSGFTLIHISVEPDLDRFDWLHWIPLTRLIPPESCFHIFGFDCIQAFALFHLIPICIALVSLIRSE